MDEKEENNNGFIPPEEYVDVIKNPDHLYRFLFLIMKDKYFLVSETMSPQKAPGLYRVDASESTN